MSKVVCVHLYSSTQKERTENKYFLENGFPNLSSTFFFFLRPHLQHMEVCRLGVESKGPLRPTHQPWQHQI